jgi:mRNA-degrading endonuclease RelE of RelBE toxin-antitoxin system
MSYAIVLSPEAIDHLKGFTARERRLVLDAVEDNLQHEPSRVTAQRKPLRPNPLASWELRVGELRVYYQIEVDEKVMIVAVGRKDRNKVIIGGKEVQL